MGEIIFITGTDTGVGKTVLTALLLQYLRGKKIHALAMKPFCTGDRNDVKILQKFQPGELSDVDMNPYFFPEPIAPFVAAEKAGEKILLTEVMEKISGIEKRCDVLLLEGAGGVMVPVGRDFLMLDIIADLRAKVVVVAPNRLGTINHSLLTLCALQEAGLKELALVLMGRVRKDVSALSNQRTLRKLASGAKVFSMPFLGQIPVGFRSKSSTQKKVKKILAALLK